MKKCANFSCEGLGDGLVSMIISHNMHLAGYQSDLFHDSFFSALQPWFPKVRILPYPREDEIFQILKTYDKIFISHSNSNPLFQKLILEGKSKCPEKFFVLNPSFSKKHKMVPYYKDAYFSPKISVAENFLRFSQNILQISNASRENGIFPDQSLRYRKKGKRVVLHAFGSKEGKKWHRFIELYVELEKLGFLPVFVMSKKEESSFPDIFKDFFSHCAFSDLSELAEFVYESGYFIGNDSGVGHLASCLQIPTVTIAKNARMSRLWRPGWSEGVVVTPSKWIPNISGFRLRDERWKQFITPAKVLRAFLQLVKTTQFIGSK